MGLIFARRAVAVYDPALHRQVIELAPALVEQLNRTMDAPMPELVLMSEVMFVADCSRPEGLKEAVSPYRRHLRWCRKLYLRRVSGVPIDDEVRSVLGLA
jgi:hypothetical protein